MIETIKNVRETNVRKRKFNRHGRFVTIIRDNSFKIELQPLLFPIPNTKYCL